MIIEADNSHNSLRNRRSRTAQAGLRPAYVFPSVISKGGGGARTCAPPRYATAYTALVANTLQLN